MNSKKSSPFSLFYLTVVLLLMYLPIVMVIAYSFNSTKLFHWEGFTLSWYAKLFSNQTIIDAFVSSLKLALASSLSAAIIGTMGAAGMAKRHFKTKGLLENIAIIPIMIPEIILGMAYLAFFSYFGVQFGMSTLVIAHTTFCVPYVFINVKASLANLDPSIGEAARDLGASSIRTFFDITMPLILPAILSGSLLAFAMSMDDVIISFFATGPTTTTLPLQVYSMLKMGVTPEINALCTVMLGAVFTLVALSRLFNRKKNAA